MATIYTAAECEAKLREIDDAIHELRLNPSQQSFDGNFLSYSGKMGELRALRRDWSLRLRSANGVERGSSSLQGPDQDI